MLYFVYDAVCCGGNGFGGQQGNFRGHKVGRGHSAQGNGVIIGALITHNTNAAHVGQRGKILAGALSGGQLIHFLAPDCISILYNGNLFLGNIADNADGKAGAGERLAGDQIFRQAQFTASLADFILEQVAQRLHNFLKVYIIRQSANIVVALDGSRFTAQAAFHNVRVDGALCQKVYSTDLLGLVLKHTDELFANDFTLALRLGNTGQLAVKTFAGVHADKVDVELAALAEHFANLLTFVLAQQAVVNKHAG